MKGRVISTILIFCLLIGLSTPTFGQSNSFNMNATIDKASYSQGDNLIVTGNVTKDDVAYSNTDVTIVVEGKSNNIKLFTYQTQTDENGDYSKSFTLNNDVELGDYVVTVNSVGISKTLDFTVSESNKETSLSLNQTRYYPEEIVKINGFVYLEGEIQSYTDVIVKILYNGTKVFTDQTQTDSNGQYKSQYNLKTNQEKGTYTVEINAVGQTISEDFEVLEKEMPVLQSITIDSTDIQLEVGEQSQLSVKGIMNDGSSVPSTELEGVTWNSSNEGIVDINSSGLMEGISAGTATITAQKGNLSDSISVTVIEESEPTTEYSLEASIPQTNYNPEDQVIISGKISNNNAGYSNADVIVKVKNTDTHTQVFTKQLKTNSQGLFSTIYNISRDVKLGNYNIEITSVNITKNISFRVSEALQTSNMTTDKDIYYQGDMVNISGIAYKQGIPQSDISVTIKVLCNDEKMAAYDLITDSEGRFSDTYNLSDNQQPGNYKIEANLLNKTLVEDFKVKLVKPEITFVNVVNGSIYKEISPDVAINKGEIVDVELLKDGSEIIGYSLGDTLNEDGNYELSVVAEALYENRNEASIEFRIDATGPSIE
uniref:Ig-like domain-containing protein n=1 Tax=Sporosalibacterium faouarense TaxID=516123 RepID=UPI00192AE998